MNQELKNISTFQMKKILLRWRKYKRRTLKEKDYHYVGLKIVTKNTEKEQIINLMSRIDDKTDTGMKHFLLIKLQFTLIILQDLNEL